MEMFLTPAIIDNKLVYLPGDTAAEEYGRDHLGEPLPVSVHKTRRDRNEHDKFRAVLRFAADNLRKSDGSPMYSVTNKKDLERAADHLLIVLKYAVGFTRTVIDRENKERTFPMSTDFTVDESIVAPFREDAYAVLGQWLGVEYRELIQGSLDAR